MAEGDKICKELLSSTKYSAQAIYALKNWIIHNESLVSGQTAVYEISERELKVISQFKTPNQVLVVVKKLPEEVNYSLIQHSNSIYLDGVQDPGNTGTILRIADWFGVRNVIRSSAGADFYHPKVIQASMGSFLRLQLFTAEWPDFQSKLQGQHVYLADMEGQNIHDVHYNSPFILVLGNEGAGVSGQIKESDHQKIHISKPESKGGAESLNVAVSAGIILSSMFKKQKL